MDTGTLNFDPTPARDKRVLVALSGGADSVALLLLLKEAGAQVCAAHFEHGIRGEDSVADMEFCRALCARLGVDFVCERARVPQSRRPGEGLEEAARRMRRAFLERAKRETGAELIATAHHADDQAETVLMHLLRGAGLRGTAGMSPCDGTYWRPLLGVRKRQLQAYLTARGQDWREDATNAAPDTPRNALRLEVLPRMEAIYPGAAQALCRFAEAQLVDAAFVEACASEQMQARKLDLPGGCFWRMQPPPAEAVLRSFWQEQLGRGRATWQAVRRLAFLCASPRGRDALPDGRIVEKTQNGLYITQRDAPRLQPAAINLGGDTLLPQCAQFHAQPCAPVPIRGKPFSQALLKSALEGAVVRTREAGDYICPLGMRGSKLLSDYLIDRKIDRPLRDRLLVVARGREALWVVGVGVSRACAVDGKNESVNLSCTPFLPYYDYFFGGTKG